MKTLCSVKTCIIIESYDDTFLQKQERGIDGEEKRRRKIKTRTHHESIRKIIRHSRI